MYRIVLALIATCLIWPAGIVAADERPVYVITHRANDLDDIQDVIDNGSNGIELDLQICPDRKTWFVHHNACDGDGAVPLPAWLSVLSIRAEDSRIALVNFDIKALPKDVDPIAMIQLRTLARALIRDDILVIYSVGGWDRRALLEFIMGDLRANEAVSIDMSDGKNWKRNIDFFAERGVTNHVFADGYTSALITPDSVWFNTREARKDGRPKMVYSWTFEAETTIRKMLIDEELDAILVNDCRVYCVNHLVVDDGVDNAFDVIESKYGLRMADRNDLARWGFVASGE